MPSYYPVYMDLAGHLCVVVGGGSVAERRVDGLLEAGTRVRVVSPGASPHLQDLAERGSIEYICAPYSVEHLEGAYLVFAATNNRVVNARASADARAKGMLTNVADAPEEGAFVVPSVVRRGEFCLSISTGGNHPMLAARLAGEMGKRFGPEYGEFVELLGYVRDTIKEETTDMGSRRCAAAAVLEREADIRTHLAAKRHAAARHLALSVARTAAGLTSLVTES